MSFRLFWAGVLENCLIANEIRVMQQIPMAANPRTDAGVIGGPVSNLRVRRNPRTFTEQEQPTVTSHIRVDLPFALHGMTGVYKMGSGCTLALSIKERPLPVAATNVGLPDINEAVEHLKLVPDIHGLVNYTQVVLSFTGFQPIDPPPNTDAARHTYLVLRKIAEPLNKFVDAYCLATKRYDIERISPKDFVYYELWHTVGDDCRPYNQTFIQFPSAELSFDAPETEGDMPLREKAVSLTSLPEPYLLASRLFAEAHRALNRHDYSLAAILGVNSIETALSAYIKAALLNVRDEQNLLRISANTYNQLERDLSLSMDLKLLFPLLFPLDVEYPQEDVDAVNRLRQARNEAIHDPIKFSKKLNTQEIVKGVMAVSNLLFTILKLS
jgi:hypothetical protein